MILVDTSVLIDFFKGVKNDPSLCLQEIIKQQIPFGITSAVYQELLQGAGNKKEYELLDEYLSCQRFFHPVDPVTSYGKAAMIYFLCRKKELQLEAQLIV